MDKLVWNAKEQSEADRMAGRFDELAPDEILKAVGAAQGEGQCPESLANFDTLDAISRKAALDSLAPSAKARLLPDLLAEDCEHFRLAEIHRGLTENNLRAKLDEEKAAVVVLGEEGHLQEILKRHFGPEVQATRRGTVEAQAAALALKIAGSSLGADPLPGLDFSSTDWTSSQWDEIAKRHEDLSVEPTDEKLHTLLLNEVEGTSGRFSVCYSRLFGPGPNHDLGTQRRNALVLLPEQRHR